MEIQELKPNRIWRHFKAMNAIPRASAKEERLVKHMVAFGESLNLQTTVDTIGNVIIKKPGTIGKEANKSVVLQSHLDMVHQKVAHSNFDFEKQGIQMYVDGDWVKAKETTLGADNGIGVATAMGVLSSNDIEHPPIEALFTVDEEIGMTGATTLKSDALTGSYLLNLDSENDSEITIGCAGGVDVIINGFYDLVALDGNYRYYEISVNGLTGGHSGVDIHLNLANAICVFASYLSELKKEIDVRLCTVNSGKFTNVIPRDCISTVAVHKSDLSKFKELSNSIAKNLKKVYRTTDAHLNIELKELFGAFFVTEQDFSDQLIHGLLTMHNGVVSMTSGMDNLVQTSNNIARIHIQDGVFNIACHARSSIDSERNNVVQNIAQSFPLGKAKEFGAYPGWAPKVDSNLLQIARKSYKKLFNNEPVVKSIHAGLECGILSGKYPEMEMISIGPNITGAHSPDESLQISSTQKMWKFLVEILTAL